MRERFGKRFWIAALIAVIVLMIIGTSVVSAISNTTAEKSNIAYKTTMNDTAGDRTLQKHIYEVMHNRIRWLYDLMIASGKADFAFTADGQMIFETARRCGIIGKFTDEDISKPLDRFFVAKTTVKAFGYQKKTVGCIADITEAQHPMDTMAYYGYFVPDMYDQVYPDRTITVEEYDELLMELKRYQQLCGKRILSFGDSIMHGNGNHEEGVADMIAEKYGMTAVDYSKPGESIGTRYTRGHIRNQMKEAYFKGEKADIILINGGTNDMGHTKLGSFTKGYDMTDAEEASFTGGLERSFWTLKNCWSGVPAIYIRAHNMNLVEDSIERQFGERALAVAEKWGIPAIDLYTDSGMNTEALHASVRYTMEDKNAVTGHDSIHPNALGYAKYYLPLICEAVVNHND